MIPKIIHFVWFNGEDFPPLIQSCMASWRKHCPDYQLRHWTMADARAIDNVFLQEASGHLQQTLCVSMQYIMKEEYI